MPTRQLMAETPRSLQRLLTAIAQEDTSAPTPHRRAFVARISRLLIHVARSITATHDDAMDAYAFVLEQLRADQCRRLREFAADPRCKLSTWLVVVVRDLCMDLYRHRYGRTRGADLADQRVLRRRLQDLIGEPIEPNDLPAPRSGRGRAARDPRGGAAVRTRERIGHADAARPTTHPSAF